MSSRTSLSQISWLSYVVYIYHDYRAWKIQGYGFTVRLEFRGRNVSKPQEFLFTKSALLAYHTFGFLFRNTLFHKGFY